MISKTMLIVIVMYCLLLFGCGAKTYEPTENSLILIEQSLKQLGLSDNIERVVLEVSGEGFITIVSTLDFIGGIVRTEIAVPYGSGRIFQLSAFDNQDTLLYQGTDTADVVAGLTTEVEIYMRPQVTMLKISPLFSQGLISVLDTFDLMVYNIDSLFGASFRVEFDPGYVRIHSVYGGDLFDQDSVFLIVSDSDYVAIGISLINSNQPQGISGWGKLASFVYEPLSVGNSFLRINSTSAKLVDWQYRNLPLDGRLYIQDGEVEIIDQ